MAAGTLTTEFATSSDGTRIAFSREGSGPTLVLVDGAMCYRDFGPSQPFTAELKGDFTVVSYDRRGRGESGDSSTYDATLEIADLKAVLDAVAGPGSKNDPAYVVGFSSGAGHANSAPAPGVPMKKLVGYEAPWVGLRGGRDYVRDLDALNAEGRGDKMVDYFMTKMIGAPFFVPIMFRFMGANWKKLKAIGSTIRYDARVMGGDFEVPANELGSVKVPTLVVWGSKAAKEMVAGNEKVAASIPGSQTRVLDGQPHNVAPAALAPVLREFLS
jgi:pimeloyl-ACP methyl ester carboxylesterase